MHNAFQEGPKSQILHMPSRLLENFTSLQSFPHHSREGTVENLPHHNRESFLEKEHPSLLRLNVIPYGMLPGNGK